MPKVSRTKKAYKHAENQDKMSKILKFTFERRIYECTIYRHYSADVIRNAIRDSLSIVDLITITDTNGRVLELHYRALKEKISIQVHRVNPNIQDLHNISRSITKTEERLAKIVENWQLDHVVDILDPEIAPRGLNLEGKQATSFDDDTEELHPSKWGVKFVAALLKLSEASVGQHAEAVRELEQARRERLEAAKGISSIQVTTGDCKMALGKMLKSLRNIAGDTIDAVDTETFVGGIGDALEGVENEIEAEKFVGGIGKALDDV